MVPRQNSCQPFFHQGKVGSLSTDTTKSKFKLKNHLMKSVTLTAAQTFVQHALGLSMAGCQLGSHLIASIKLHIDQHFQVCNIAVNQSASLLQIDLVEFIKLLLQRADPLLNSLDLLTVPPADARGSKAYTCNNKQRNHEGYLLLFELYQPVRNFQEFTSQSYLVLCRAVQAFQLSHAEIEQLQNPIKKITRLTKLPLPDFVFFLCFSKVEFDFTHLDFSLSDTPLPLSNG